MPISNAAKSISSVGARHMSPKKFIQSARAAAKTTGFNELKAARMAKAITRGQAMVGSLDTKKRFVGGVMKEAGILNTNRYGHATTGAVRAYEKAVTGEVKVSKKDPKVVMRLANRAREERQGVNRVEQNGAPQDKATTSIHGQKKSIRSLSHNALEDSVVSMHEYKRLKAEGKKPEPPKQAPVIDMFGDAA